MPLTQSRIDLGYIPLSSRCIRYFSLPDHASIFSIYPLSGQGRHVWQIVRQLSMKSAWSDASLCAPEITVQGNCLWRNFNFCQWKFLSIFLYNVKFNVNIEFLKIATLEPILSRETGFWFCSEPVDTRVQCAEPSVQSPAPSVQGPESNV